MGLTKDEAQRVIERMARLCEDVIRGNPVDALIGDAYEAKKDLAALSAYIAGSAAPTNGNGPEGGEWKAKYEALLAQYREFMRTMEGILSPPETI